MTISYTDNTNRFINYIDKNFRCKIINPFFISLIITCILMVIININIDNKITQFIYSFFTVFPIILLFNKFIKSQYSDKEKTGANDEISFIKMMENNSLDKNIHIIKKLDNLNNTNSAESDINNFLNSNN